MDTLTEALHRGGPFLVLLLGLAGLSLPITLLLGGLGATKLKVPAFAWLVMPSLLLLGGLAATLQGMLLAAEAVSFAAIETRSILASAGLSIALLTSIVGTSTAAMLLVISAWVAACGALVQSAEGELTSRIPAVLGGGVLLLGGGGLLASSIPQGAPMPGLALTLLACGPALALAGIRVRKASASAQAEHQLAVGACSIGAVLLVAAAYALQGTAELHQAVANAGPELRATMMSAGVALQQQAMVMGPVAVLIAALGSAAGCAAALHALPKRRLLLSAVLTGLFLLGAGALAGGIQRAFTRLSAHWPAYVLADIQTNAAGLPRDETPSGVPGHAELVTEPVQVLQEQNGQWLDQGTGQSGLPVILPLPSDTNRTLPGPLLVVSGDRPAIVISQSQWSMDPIDLQVLVHSEVSPHAQDNPWLKIASTRSLRLSWVPEQTSPAEPAITPEPARLMDFSHRQISAMASELEHDEGVLFIIDTNDENLLWQPGLLYSTHSSIDETASALQAQLASAAVERLIFVPGTSWSVQDLLSLCATTTHAAQQLDCMLLPALERPAALSSSQSASMGEPGVLDMASISAVIERHISSLRYCYQRALSQEPSLSGEVTIELVVTGAGAVRQSTVRSSTLDAPAVEACIAARFLALSFPPPASGEDTTITHPLRFEPIRVP